jgi:hypothetical protein
MHLSIYVPILVCLTVAILNYETALCEQIFFIQE